VTSHLFALDFGANEPLVVARFWSGFLGRELVDEPDGGYLLPPGDDPGFRLRFVPAPEPKPGPNYGHFDLTSESLVDQQEKVARALALGGRHLDIGQLPEEEHVVLADPGDNEFCVIEPGNKFLAGCGFIGALSSDGTQQVGYFWSAALGWPLVWDQDEETAIQAPGGGPKISWGGPPVAPKTGRSRPTFSLVADGDLPAEVDRLVSLGARRIGAGPAGSVELADPDGNDFRVAPPR
jgi:hypothetical protein